MTSELSPFKFEVVRVDAQGQPGDRQQSIADHQVENLDGDVRLEMVAIPGGTFSMGAPETEEGWSGAQNPQHSVTIQPFLIGKYPVTQAQWQAVAALPKVNQSLDPDPASGKGADSPVEQVTWDDAVEFCQRLSEQTGQAYRLPSEAEWEYACRAGTQTPFHFGETITTDLANYSGINWEYDGKIYTQGSYGAGPQGEDRRQTTPVGSFSIANPFGLYDMHGNVWEWCADLWHDTYQGAPTDGTAWLNDQSSPKRLMRGGSWNSSPQCCRSAFRTKLDPDARLYDIGFRIACSQE